MLGYQVEIKQLVDYPRCRVHREFIQTLIADWSIRTNNGCSGLFYYAVLCSYANFRTSYRRIDGITYTIYPGEWVCTFKELSEWLRLRTKRRIFDVLDGLQDDHLIDYKILGRDKLVRYQIKDWRRHNTVLDYNCPCQKDTGFYFLPVSTATDLISVGRCSEMDILLDLWISAVYNDERVQGSFTGPVAYFRNGSGKPLVSYADLAARWGISKATVGRVLKKLSRLGHITLVTFPGRHGTVIYLKNYLSTMFQISDVMVDKAEVALSLNIKFLPPDAEPEAAERFACGPTRLLFVSKAFMDNVAQNVLQLLERQGVACSQCHRCSYQLYPLSDDGTTASVPHGGFLRPGYSPLCICPVPWHSAGRGDGAWLKSPLRKRWKTIPAILILFDPLLHLHTYFDYDINFNEMSIPKTGLLKDICGFNKCGKKCGGRISSRIYQHSSMAFTARHLTIRVLRFLALTCILHLSPLLRE